MMTPQLDEPFIIANWVKMCLDAFEKQGLDAYDLMQSAQLCASELQSPLAPVHTDKINALFDAVIATTQCESIGIDAGKNISLTTFHALGYAVIASQSLWEGFSRVIRYNYGISNVTRLYLQTNGDEVELGVVREGEAPLHDAILDAAACMMVRICRFLTPQGTDLLRVSMGRDRPADYENYERYFRSPVSWGDSRYRLVFSRNYFHCRLPNADVLLANENERLCEIYFGRLFNRKLTQRVRSLLRQTMATEETSLQKVAHTLHLSERSLQRHLSQEGTNFRELVDEVRQEIAERYLKSSSMSISQIAYSLGFNDAGNFSRAFKRWFSCSPETYRQSLQESPLL
ncbi:AraC family transcriptional regulator [Hahella sp. HN01]|uniref:AraC family transcriptional regulator n=2 Tax=unclassified Hahella TaxID=2624107 RepID=UPI0020A6479C|nr:AraC family transcriptional regulator [Hahella sp. HN01]